MSWSKKNQHLEKAKEEALSSISDGHKKRLTKFEKLVQFQKNLAKDQSLPIVMQKGLSYLQEISNCQEIFLYTPTHCEGKKFLERELIEKHSLLEVRVPFDETSFVGSVAKSQSPEWIESLNGDKRFMRNLEELSRFNIKTLATIPLLIEDQVIGVIQALWNEQSTPKGDTPYFFETACDLFATSFYSAELVRRGQEQFMQMAQAFADAIGKKDSYTGGHTRRVAYYSSLIANEMPSLTERQRRELHVASVLHDLGKIGVEDSILKKQAPLDASEFEVMKLHPDFGFEILKCIDGLDNILDAVRFHHERPDGKGYPHGLKGDEIPFIARIVAVSDTFDAMTSNRPYRAGLAPMIAYEEIVTHSGTQFDPRVVEAFVKGFKKTPMYQEEEDPFLEEKFSKAG